LCNAENTDTLEFAVAVAVAVAVEVAFESPVFRCRKILLKMDQKVTLFEPKASFVTFPFLVKFFGVSAKSGVAFFGLPFLAKQKR
jgi:hypothetical protein